MTMPIDTTQLPAEVRSGGPRAQKLYASALDFEKLLTTQLTQSLSGAIGDGSSDDATDDGGDGVTSGGSSALSQLKAQLPAQLADAVQQAGGLGLAPVLYRALKLQDGGAK